MIDLTHAEAIKPLIRDASRAGNLALYNEAQSRGLTFSELLEERDPSPRTSDGNVDSPLDAFERQLAVFDLRIAGRNSATVEQFLMSDAAILAPEFVLREIKRGYEMVQNPAELVAVQVPENGPSVKPVYFKPSTVMKTAARVGENAAFPVVTVNYREKEAVMIDRGRQFDFPYRVIRHQRLTEFRTLLWAIGAQLASDELNDIYKVLHDGDGTSPAATNVFTGTPGTLAYSDLVHLAVEFGAPSRMTHLMGSGAEVERVLNLSQYQDPSLWKDGSALAKQGGYNGFLPLSGKLVLAPSGNFMHLVGFDARFALRESVAQPLMVEAEKIISAKFETAVVSKESVYTVLLEDAVRVINYEEN